jgi:hypothetical protein
MGLPDKLKGHPDRPMGRTDKKMECPYKPMERQTNKVISSSGQVLKPLNTSEQFRTSPELSGKVKKDELR